MNIRVIRIILLMEMEHRVEELVRFQTTLKFFSLRQSNKNGGVLWVLRLLL